MAYLSEAALEKLVLGQLNELGYATSSDTEIGPDGKSPERDAYADVVLTKRLATAIARTPVPVPISTIALGVVRASSISMASRHPVVVSW